MTLTAKTVVKVFLNTTEIPFIALQMNFNVNTPGSASINVPYFSNIKDMPPCCPLLVTVQYMDKDFVVFSGRVVSWDVSLTGSMKTLTLSATSWSAILGQHDIHCSGVGPLTYAPIVNGSSLINPAGMGVLLDAVKTLSQSMEGVEQKGVVDAATVKNLLPKIIQTVYALAAQYNGDSAYGHGYLGGKFDNKTRMEMLVGFTAWDPAYLSIPWLLKAHILSGLSALQNSQQLMASATFERLFATILSIVSYVIVDNSYPSLNGTMSCVDMMPRLLYGAVPKCNVVVPDTIVNMSVSRNYMREPTRVTVHQFMPHINMGAVYKKGTNTDVSTFEAFSGDSMEAIRAMIAPTDDELPGKGVVTTTTRYQEDLTYLAALAASELYNANKGTDEGTPPDGVTAERLNDNKLAAGPIARAGNKFAKYLYDVGQLCFDVHVTTVGPASYLLGAPIIVPLNDFPVIGVITSHMITVSSQGRWTNTFNIDFARATFTDKNLPEILGFSATQACTAGMMGDKSEPLTSTVASDKVVLDSARSFVNSISDVDVSTVALRYRYRMTEANILIASNTYDYFCKQFVPDFTMWDREVSNG